MLREKTVHELYKTDTAEAKVFHQSSHYKKRLLPKTIDGSALQAENRENRSVFPSRIAMAEGLPYNITA